MCQAEFTRWFDEFGGNIMPLLAILIALFMISGCTAPKSAKPVPASAPTTSTAVPQAQFIDRGAETSRVLDHGPPPESASTQGAIHSWQVSVLKKLEPYMRWPDDAPSDVKSASPVVRVTINRQGDVLSVKVVKSSGYESFDRAARKLFKRAAILPPPPPEMTGSPLSFNMAVTFTA